MVVTWSRSTLAWPLYEVSRGTKMILKAAPVEVKKRLNLLESVQNTGLVFMAPAVFYFTAFNFIFTLPCRTAGEIGIRKGFLN